MARGAAADGQSSSRELGTCGSAISTEVHAGCCQKVYSRVLKLLRTLINLRPARQARRTRDRIDRAVPLATARDGRCPPDSCGAWRESSGYLVYRFIKT